MAILFPGQGSHHPGMLADLPDGPAARHVVEEARDRCAAMGLRDDLDSADALGDNVYVQTALLIAGVAGARTLIDEQHVLPAFVAGHSVGAFAAAVTAGVLTLAEALEAVELRARSMKQQCARGRWGMAALTGLPIRAARQLVDEVTTSDAPLWLANLNTATQTVLSGTMAALARAEEAAKSAGAHGFERLPVTVASHCPVQEATAQLLADHLAGFPTRHPTARYLTNTRARAAGTADHVLDDLAQAVARPVHWYDAMRLLPELGVTASVETQPGHALTSMMHAIAPSVTAIALQDATPVTAAAKLRNAQRVRDRDVAETS